MKRFATYVGLCAVAACALPAISSAQPNEFHYGGQIGLTEARLTDLGSLLYTFPLVAPPFDRTTVTVTGGTTSFNPGIAFGGWGYYVVNPNFGLQLGVFFSQQGGTLRQSGSQIVKNGPGEFADSTLVQYEFEHDAELRYIRFPLLAKVQYPTKYVTPFVKFGPDLGILTEARLESRGFHKTPQLTGDQLFTVDESEDYKDRFRGLGISLHVSGGIDVPIRSAAVYAEVGYSVGLNDVNENQSDFSEGVKNSVLTASLGFYF